MPANVKGYRMKYIVEEVDKKAGMAGIKNLEEEYGNLDFKATEIYSEDDNIRLLIAATKVIFKNTNGSSLFEMGRILAQKLISTKMTKIGISMVSKTNIFENTFLNPTILRTIEKTIPFFAPSLKVQLENPDKNTIKIKFLDTKVPRKLYEGEWFELFSQLIKEKVSSDSKQITSNSYEIMIYCENFQKLNEELLN